MSKQQITKVFEDNVLVSLKKTLKNEKDPKYKESLQKLHAQRTALKKAAWAFDELQKEVSFLRKELIITGSALRIRTKERNSVSEAHKKKLQEIESLKYQKEDLEYQVEALQEENQDLSNALTRVRRERASRGVAAKPFKVSER